MAQQPREHRPGQGNLLMNKKTNDKQPDYYGSLTLDHDYRAGETIRLSGAGDNPPSPIDNYYNGSSIYIQSGTGAGQLRRIIDYEGATKTITVNTAFATTCNTDSRALISPTVTSL